MKNDEFLENKYFKTFNANSTKVYKESFNLEKYEFTENKMLIKNIKSFFAGSMISLNEKMMVMEFLIKKFGISMH